MNTPRIDRGDAVNLASNLISRRDTGSYRDGVTDKGMKTLLDSVLLMDEGIRQLEAELAAAQRQIASVGHVATGATEAYYDADETIADLRQKLAAAQERIRAMDGGAADAAKYHKLMHLLRDTKIEHGLCQPRERRACTRCNATDDIEKMIAQYKGAPVTLNVIDASIAKEADRG